MLLKNVIYEKEKGLELLSAKIDIIDVCRYKVYTGNIWPWPSNATFSKTQFPRRATRHLVSFPGNKEINTNTNHKINNIKLKGQTELSTNRTGQTKMQLPSTALWLGFIITESLVALGVHKLRQQFSGMAIRIEVIRVRISFALRSLFAAVRGVDVLVVIVVEVLVFVEVLLRHISHWFSQKRLSKNSQIDCKKQEFALESYLRSTRVAFDHCWSPVAGIPFITTVVSRTRLPTLRGSRPRSSRNRRVFFLSRQISRQFRRITNSMYSETFSD